MLRAHRMIALQGSNPMSWGPGQEFGLSTVFQRGRSSHSFPVERVLGCDVLTQHFDDTQWGCLLADFCWLIFPHGYEDPKRDTGCSRDGLFGVSGRAAELGSDAFVSETTLFALKYLQELRVHSATCRKKVKFQLLH